MWFPRPFAFKTIPTTNPNPAKMVLKARPYKLWQMHCTMNGILNSADIVPEET